MCLDIYSVGNPITIDFLHEQLWFQPGISELSVDMVCDVVLRNQSKNEISQLRIQFPHYLQPDEVEVLSDPTTNGSNSSLDDKYSWIGDYSLEPLSNEMTLTLKLTDPSLERAGALKPAHCLYGSFEPDGIIPTLVHSDYLREMKKIDQIALDLDLDTPLPAGATGWLRLRIRPKSWPKDEDLVSLPGLEFIGGNYRYKSQFTVISPVHLRQNLQRDLHESGVCEDAVVNKGWRLQPTLTRVVDHRISMIVPDNVEVGQILSKPDTSFRTFGPIRSNLVDNRYLLHFATGSNLNKSRDLVCMAEKICDYCEFLQVGSEPPTKDHLVTRCGGSEHESVGTLIEEMINSHLIFEKDGRIHSQTGAKRAEHLLDLRRRYTFPAKDVPFLNEMYELHPFSISLSLKWIQFTETQTRRMKVIDSIATLFDEDDHDRLKVFDLLLKCGERIAGKQRPSRHGLFVACDDYKSRPEENYRGCPFDC